MQEAFDFLLPYFQSVDSLGIWGWVLSGLFFLAIGLWGSRQIGSPARTVGTVIGTLVEATHYEAEKPRATSFLGMVFGTLVKWLGIAMLLLHFVYAYMITSGIV